MNPHYTYLMVDAGCLIMPLLLSFHPRLNFYKQWRFFLLPCLVTALFFLVWDALYTHLGIWGFNPDYVCGIYVLKMPIEELLFFICIPFACVFSYHVFSVLWQFNFFNEAARGFYISLSVLLLIAGLFFIDKLYTGVTFLLLSVMIAFLLYKRVQFLSTFFFCFLFILIPFMASNGVLTGSFLGRTIVWYDNNENLGIRLLTIPVEDIFYAMLLLLMNVYGFECMKRRGVNNLPA